MDPIPGSCLLITILPIFSVLGNYSSFSVLMIFFFFFSPLLSVNIVNELPHVELELNKAHCRVKAYKVT